MSRIMALDVGESTVGIAVSDPLGLTAQPVATLRRTTLAKDLAAIHAMVRSHEVTSIVVGLPLRMSGEAGPAAVAAIAFAKRIGEAVKLPVTTWDERLTTVQAERCLLEADLSRRHRRRVIDTVAAALILQSFLDSRKAGI